jgi:hypothetical protein
MTAIAASLSLVWARLAGRDTAPERLAGLGPNLCKEAGLLPEARSWVR